MSSAYLLKGNAASCVSIRCNLGLGIGYFYYCSTVVAIVTTIKLRAQLGLQFKVLRAPLLVSSYL